MLGLVNDRVGICLAVGMVQGRDPFEGSERTWVEVGVEDLAEVDSGGVLRKF